MAHLYAIIDSAAPDVDGELREHSRLTGHLAHIREDYLLAKTLGLTTLRTGVSWSLIEKEEGVRDWKRLDEMYALAEGVGVQIFPTLSHFSWPLWLTKGEGGVPCLDPRLPQLYAQYVEDYCQRYHGRFFEAIPVVEIATEGMMRACFSQWDPQHKADYDLEKRIVDSLVETFNSVADVLRHHGIAVLSNEPADFPHLAARLDADVHSINHYAQIPAHGEVKEMLRRWDETITRITGKRPFLEIGERGPTEHYCHATREGSTEFIIAGTCDNRTVDLQLTVDGVHKVREEGVRVSRVGVYLVSNVLGPTFKFDPSEAFRPCDRNGLYDHEEVDALGRRERIPCTALIEEVKRLHRPCMVLIGSSGGIGSKIRELLKADGTNVITVDRSDADVEWDMKDFAIIDKVAEMIMAEAAKRQRNITHAVFASGVMEREEGVSEDVLNSTLAVNLRSPLALVEKMIAHCRDLQHVVMMSSGHGMLKDYQRSWSETIAYDVSKSALNAYVTRRGATMSRPIISAFDPGWVKTDMGGQGAERDPVQTAREAVRLLHGSPSTGRFWWSKKEVLCVREW